MTNIFKCTLLLTTFIFVEMPELAAQKAPEITWQRYSPDGAEFALTIPGRALPPQGHIFDPKGSSDVYRLIEPGTDVRVFNFETELNGKRWFLASILQIRRSDRRLPKLLADSKASVINTIIADGLTTSAVINKKSRDSVTFQWFYKRMSQGNLDLAGVVKLKITETHAIVLVIDCDRCEPKTAAIQRVLDSL